MFDTGGRVVRAPDQLSLQLQAAGRRGAVSRGQMERQRQGQQRRNPPQTALVGELAHSLSIIKLEPSLRIRTGGDIPHGRLRGLVKNDKADPGRAVAKGAGLHGIHRAGNLVERLCWGLNWYKRHHQHRGQRGRAGQGASQRLSRSAHHRPGVGRTAASR